MAFSHEMILDTHLHNPAFTKGIRLTKATLQVARYFAKRAECWSCESIAFIAKKLWIDPKTVTTAFATLRKLGILEEESRGFGKTYYRKLSLPDAPYTEGAAKDDADRYFAYMSKMNGGENFPNCEGKTPDLYGKNSLHKKKQLKQTGQKNKAIEASPIDRDDSCPEILAGKKEPEQCPDLKAETAAIDKTIYLPTTVTPAILPVQPLFIKVHEDEPLDMRPTLTAQQIKDNLDRTGNPSGKPTYNQAKVSKEMPSNLPTAYLALAEMERKVSRKDPHNRLAIGYAERASYKKFAYAVGENGRANHSGAIKALAFALANWKAWNEYCGRPQDKYETPTLKYTLSFEKYSEKLVMFCRLKVKQYREFNPMPWISTTEAKEATTSLDLTPPSPVSVGNAPSRSTTATKSTSTVRKAGGITLGA